MNKLQEAEATINIIREKSDTCVLFNSFGKDSLVVLDLVAKRFKRVICVFMYFVPHLDHIDRFIHQCICRYDNVEVLQMPHWNLSYVRRGGMYCEANSKEKLLKLRDAVDKACSHIGCPYVFLGMKKADSMNRRLMLNGYESQHYINGNWGYPLATWTQKEVLAYMKQHHLPSPVRYGTNASNGVGFNIDCFLWMREHAPQDLEKMYEYFPQSRRILFEYDYKNQNI